MTVLKYFKNGLLLFLILIHVNSFSQNQILVPFRVGDKYGLSDLDGKLVYSAEYDNVTLSEYDPAGVFYAKKGNKTTLFYKNKIVLKDVEYSDFKIVKNKCILTKKERNYEEKQTYNNQVEYEFANKRKSYYSLFNIQGENVYPENFKELRILKTDEHRNNNKSNNKYIVFISINYDDLRSIFIYDCDLQKITEWLAKDVHTLEIDRNLEGMAFNIKKTKDDLLKQVKLVFENNKFKLIPINSTVKNETNVNDSDEEYEPEPTMGLGSSDGNAFVADAADDVPWGDPHNRKIIQKRTIETLFKLKEGKIFYYEKEAKKDTLIKELKLPFPIETTKIENYYLQLYSTELKNVVSHNLILVKSNTKYGIIISDSILIEPKYDSIIMLSISNNSLGYNIHNFLVGIRDPETKKMYFGTIDVYGKTVIPIKYENIQFDKLRASDEDRKRYPRKFHYYISSKEWLIKMDGKFGYISPTDSVILKPEYDEITQNEGYSFDFNTYFKILKKDNLYGILEGEGNRKIFIEPVFLKKPAYLIHDYQEVKGKTLVGLVDENSTDKDYFKASFFCFGDEKGKLFYREK